jgi:hypothetical protein
MGELVSPVSQSYPNAEGGCSARGVRYFFGCLGLATYHLRPKTRGTEALARAGDILWPVWT